MAQQLVRGGAPLDIPTAEENAGAVDARMRAFWHEQAAIEEARQREYARGLKRMEAYLTPSTAASTYFTGVLVDEGYVWSLRMASAVLAASDTLIIYRATQSGSTRRPVFNGASAATQVATWSSDQVRLRHGDGLYLATGGQNITSVFIAAWQVPAEREYEFA